jgi:hypothetical protein
LVAGAMTHTAENANSEANTFDYTLANECAEDLRRSHIRWQVPFDLPCVNHIYVYAYLSQNAKKNRRPDYPPRAIRYHGLRIAVPICLGTQLRIP